jgi:hypothetical protein
MDVAKILATVAMIGSDLPAYAALFNQVKTLLSDADQATLQAAYADAMAASDKAHAAAQAL